MQFLHAKENYFHCFLLLLLVVIIIIIIIIIICFVIIKFSGRSLRHVAVLVPVLAVAAAAAAAVVVVVFVVAAAVLSMTFQVPSQLQKATVKFIPSVCLSVHVEHLGPR
jgi:uncharacterized protein (UPF0333 family)